MVDPYSQLTHDQRFLTDRMAAISEDCYCAGWMTGLEYVLWEMVTDPNFPRHWGQGDVSEQDIESLKLQSDRIGGWIYWRDDETDPELTHRQEEWGETFVPMDQWLRMVEENNAARVPRQHRG